MLEQSARLQSQKQQIKVTRASVHHNRAPPSSLCTWSSLSPKLLWAQQHCSADQNQRLCCFLLPAALLLSPSHRYSARCRHLRAFISSALCRWTDIIPFPWWRAELDRVNTGPPPQMLSLTNKGHQNNLNRKLKRPYAARLYFFFDCASAFVYVLKHPERPVCVPVLTATQSSGDRHDQICFICPLKQS